MEMSGLFRGFLRKAKDFVVTGFARSDSFRGSNRPPHSSTVVPRHRTALSLARFVVATVFNGERLLFSGRVDRLRI
jgi:hypothetical protein